jgi:pyruvate dehydrogenase E2 component (dihydrolipoamide acetyltransferase)
MATIIDMPKLSDTMTVGTLVNWLKNEGDAVSPGDMLAEVETDKATMELENFDEGILLKQYVKVGEQVPIGAPIAAIGKKGETAPEAPLSNAKKATPKPEVKKEELKVLNLEPIASAPPPAMPVSSNLSNERIKASPLARKIASSQGVSLQGLQGTGPGGRIVKADVLSAAEKGFTSVTSFSGKSFGGPIAKDEAIPVSNMRRTIATHLVHSKTTIPHFYLDIEVNAEPFMDLRALLNKNGNGVKLTVNDFILKASVEALRRVPRINSSWQQDVIQQHGSVHLAFGVAIEHGLVTPVIRDAHAKSLHQISAEVKVLAEKARNKKLSPNEMSGHTFTVTNLGMFNINSFFGIINPPDAGILSVGATVKKPVVDSHSNITVGYRMNIGFSGDHRVVDGVTGAEFLAALKEILENPALMFV